MMILTGAADAAPVEEWNRTYGDTGEDILSDLRQTTDGGYIISGSTCLNRTPQCEGLLIKTDAKGNLEWKRTYSGSTMYVRQTMDGGYIAIGNLYPTGFFYLFKTDGNGSTLWNRTYNGNIKSVLQTGDGRYTAAGSIADPASGHLDAWLIRTDADGRELWNKKYGGVGNEHVTSFQLTPDGGYLLDIWGGQELFKTDADGNELWNRKTKPDAGYPTSVLQTGDGGYVMIGSIGDEYWLDAWLARTDANFTIQFTRQFRLRQPWNSARSVTETSDGGYLMVVDTGFRETRVEDYEIWLVRTDNNGSMLWSRRFSRASSDNCAVHQTQDGGYIIGFTRYRDGLKDIWVTKMKSDVNLSSVPEAPVNPPGEMRNGSIEAVSENPIPYNLSTGSKPKEEINNDVPGFEFVFPVVSFLLAYLFGSRKLHERLGRTDNLNIKKAFK